MKQRGNYINALLNINFHYTYEKILTWRFRLTLYFCCKHFATLFKLNNSTIYWSKQYKCIFYVQNYRYENKIKLFLERRTWSLLCRTTDQEHFKYFVARALDPLLWPNFCFKIVLRSDFHENSLLYPSSSIFSRIWRITPFYFTYNKSFNPLSFLSFLIPKRIRN